MEEQKKSSPDRTCSCSHGTCGAGGMCGACAPCCGGPCGCWRGRWVLRVIIKIIILIIIFWVGMKVGEFRAMNYGAPYRVHRGYDYYGGYPDQMMQGAPGQTGSSTLQ